MQEQRTTTADESKAERPPVDGAPLVVEPAAVYHDGTMYPLHRSAQALAAWLTEHPAPETKPAGAANACELAFLVTPTANARGYGHLRKNEIAWVHGAQLDLDGGTLENIRNTLQAVQDMGLEGLFWWSHSSTEERPKGRLILVYERPASPQEHERIYPTIVSELEAQCFATSMQYNCNRGWNRPRASAPPTVLNGGPLHVDWWVQVSPERPVAEVDPNAGDWGSPLAVDAERGAAEVARVPFDRYGSGAVELMKCAKLARGWGLSWDDAVVALARWNARRSEGERYSPERLERALHETDVAHGRFAHDVQAPLAALAELNARRAAAEPGEVATFTPTQPGAAASPAAPNAPNEPDGWTRMAALEAEAAAGRPYGGDSAVVRAYLQDQYEVRYNVLCHQIQRRRRTDGPDAPWVEWEDHHDIEVRDALEYYELLQVGGGKSGPRKGRTLSANLIHEALVRLARDHEYDPVVDYLEGLPPWDGVGRVDGLFTDYFRCTTEDATLREVTRAAGWVLTGSMVARVLQPGCQADITVVVSGEQGARKSSALRALVPEYIKGAYVATELDWSASNRADLYSTVTECWLLEYAELAGLRRAETNRVKSFLTGREDSFRMPYARTAKKHPRRSIVVGTINPEAATGFLVDDTGNRRFLVVETTATEMDPISTSRIEADRDQIWAEALARFRRGESWWLEGGLLQAQRTANERHEAGDEAWEPAIRRWFERGCKSRVTQEDVRIEVRGGSSSALRTCDVLEHALGIPVDRQGRAEQMRCSKAMAKALGTKRGTFYSDGGMVKAHELPEPQPPS